MEQRLYRVVTCANCDRIYRYRRTKCPRCEATERVASMVSRARIEQAALENMASVRELSMPRSYPVNGPERVPLWRRAFAASAEGALHVAELLHRR